MPRRFLLIWLALALGLALIAYAWVDGGREPLREIVVPVALPEIAK